MTATTLSAVLPIEGPTYDRTRPETRQPWLDFRRGGLTATEVRDCHQGAARRKIITEKVTGEHPDVSVMQFRHGALREPQIAAWLQATYGISPTEATYASGVNGRWIASPDGVSRDPFSGALLVGTEDAVLAEIKVSSEDLRPGTIDAAGVLVELDPKSPFARHGYYRQVQWQILVMNATASLFAWEQHDGVVDPETSTYTPVGPPRVVRIPRDQEFIDHLVRDVATPLLEEIDAARLAFSLDGLPPASADLDSEHAALVADLLKARDAEAVATAAKEKAWAALKAHYLAEGAPDVTIDGGFAKITVSTSRPSKKFTDTDAMKRRAPALVAKYEALVKRFTSTVPGDPRRTLTITRSETAPEAPTDGGNV